MLHGLDQPEAVEFVVRELAATTKRLEGTNSFSPFALSANREWERQQEKTGRAMSEPSRKRLLDIWQDRSNGKHLRRQAFKIWASTPRPGDVEILRAVSSADALADTALWQRLRLGDREAIPAMISRLTTDDSGYWWQLGRYIWSDDLTKALDEALERRGATLSAAGPDAAKLADADWILSEMVMRLPTSEANVLLNKHWNQLSVSYNYVIAALYVATPNLGARVAAVINAAPDPKELFKHLSFRFGYKVGDHPGLTRPEQIAAILPYLDMLDDMEIYDFWSACNEHGWLTLRRAHLDSRLTSRVRERIYLDDTRVMKALDEFLAKNDQWINHWLDDFLKSGASLDDVMDIIGRWLQGKSDLQALKIASGGVLHLGERRHLDLLRAAKIEPPEMAAAIVADTEFGVRRRTLSA
jgi:hypothetical protein